MNLREEIESRISIVDIVSRYVNIKKAGVNYKALCPFHSEKTPSFIISPQKNIAHCFSCGKGGGPIKFLMEIEKIDFKEAVSLLAKEAGIELKTDFYKEKQSRGGDIYLLYREASKWYHDSLYKEENKKYLDYLYARGISDETIRKFQLGCSTSPRDLYFFLKEKGFTHQFLIDSGLFLSESRDKFFSRITFPIANTMGHTVGFTARVIDDSLPKYLNSPTSPIFDKSSILYGLHLAKQAITKTGKVYIVEGQMDTIRFHQDGYENVVGISGTALTKEHIKILKRFAKTFFLCLDRDSAGIKATFSSIENLLNEDIDFKIINLRQGKDPDEFSRQGGDFSSLDIQKTKNSAHRQLSFSEETSLSVIEFYLEEGHKEYDVHSVIGKKKLIEKCLELLTKITSKIEIDFYIQQISKHQGISTSILYEEFKRIQRKGYKEKSFIKQDAISDDSCNNKNFSPPELLAGYILRYNLFDLFFREFHYTLDDFPQEDGFSLLRSVISQKNLDIEDEERMKVIDMFLELEHPDDHSIIEQICIQLIKKIHEMIILSLYKKELASGTPILKAKSLFIPQARMLGISQNIFK